MIMKPGVAAWMDRDFLTHAVPARFQTYLRLRGSCGQLVQFMAVVAGLKPAMDDWIAVERLGDFSTLLTQCGLVSSVDSFFEFIDVGATGEIVGGEYLNTTRARGHSPDASPPAGSIAHVFMAREQALLDRAMATGWYTLVTDNRIMDKPWIDHDRFGQCLGYPDCCRRAFASYNNWNNNNSYYQSWRATSTASYLCNSLMKHSGLAYASHIPCAFDCNETKRYADAVRSIVLDWSPALAQAIDQILSYSYLVLSEWEIYGLVSNAYEGNRLHYSGAFIAPTNRPDEELFRHLRAGDALEVERDVIRIYSQDQVVATYRSKSNRFGPQVPFVIQFSH